MSSNQSTFIWDESFTANADLSAKQFYALKLVAGPKVDIPSAATDRCIGILQNKPTSGHAASVRLLGQTQVYSDGSGTAIAVGDYLGTSATGTLVKKATADYNVLGLALGASSAAGTRIPMLMLPISWFRTAAG